MTMLKSNKKNQKLKKIKTKLLLLITIFKSSLPEDKTQLARVKPKQRRTPL